MSSSVYYRSLCALHNVIGYYWTNFKTVNSSTKLKCWCLFLFFVFQASHFFFSCLSLSPRLWPICCGPTSQAFLFGDLILSVDWLPIRPWRVCSGSLSCLLSSLSFANSSSLFSSSTIFPTLFISSDFTVLTVVTVGGVVLLSSATSSFHQLHPGSSITSLLDDSSNYAFFVRGDFRGLAKSFVFGVFSRFASMFFFGFSTATSLLEQTTVFPLLGRIEIVCPVSPVNMPFFFLNNPSSLDPRTRSLIRIWSPPLHNGLLTDTKMYFFVFSVWNGPAKSSEISSLGFPVLENSGIPFVFSNIWCSYLLDCIGDTF